MITGGQGRRIAWMDDGHTKMFDTRAIEAYRRDLIGVLNSLDDYHARAVRTAVEATMALTERKIGDSRAWLEGYRRRRDAGPWSARQIALSRAHLDDHYRRHRELR